MDDEQPEREDDDYHDEPEPNEPISDMPAIPCDFLPGSELKINALRERYERGEPLWHPGDMTFERYGQTISEIPRSIFPA